MIDIVTLWFNDRISELLCRLLFPTFVFFCPFCGSEYCGSLEDFFKLIRKGEAGECEDIEGYWLILDIY
ncbi:hypothetical protein EF405_20675 [Cyclobacteriaceae bacterium YHN15]|nr:hypothetical protein EF405_20675 [Cyclobacteriaceae bacterium YHN15]